MSDNASDAPRGLKQFRGFSRDFWVINLIELFERGAYYSFAPLLTLFMISTFTANGMAGAQAATIAGVVTSVNFFLLYAVPLFAAAVAEKYGYKSALVVSFALLIVGYGAIYTTGTIGAVLTMAVIVGFGAGIFKPIAAAMVAQTTTLEQRNAGYAVYYGFINLGAFIFPTAVAAAALFDPALLIPVAFYTAAALSVLNAVLVLTVFRNVNPPRRDVSLGKAFVSLGAIFKQPGFLMLLIIYCGFWFMYALNLSFLPTYMVQFARMPLWFAATLTVSLNALVIIVGAPLIATLTSRFSSLSLMTVGIGGYALSLLVVGWTTTSLLFVTGIVLFSIFELVTHPSYLAYVSKIAPPDKVSVYLGYGFLPIAVGQTIGSSVAGALYGTMAIEQGNPAGFWGIISAVGIGTAAAMLLYNFVLGVIRNRRDAPAGAAAAPRRFRGIAGPAVAVIAILLIPAVVMGSTLAPNAKYVGDMNVEPLSTGATELVKLDPVSGETEERQRTAVPFTIPAGAVGDARLTLKWTDEAPQAGSQNAPDVFRLHVTLADGTMLMSKESNNGKLEFRFPATPGDHTVEVELVDAGDHTVTLGPVPVPAGDTADTSNDWTLDRDYATA